MSCIYCDIKMRPLDDDTKVLKGDGWKDGLGYEGGYIGPSHDGKFRMVVSYDAGFASTEVDNIKYCPFCGAELKMPPEPLIKDEKIRKAVRAWAEACGAKQIKYSIAPNQYYDADMGTGLSIKFMTKPIEVYLEEDKTYTIAELCGEEECES